VNRRLLDIGVRRGRLLERIAAQRRELTAELRPLGAALQTTDHALQKLRSGVDYVKAHPATFAAAFLVLLLLKPRRVWRWTQRGIVAWRTWQLVRTQFARFARRVGI